MEPTTPSFWTRLGMAFVCFFRLLFSPRFAAEVRPVYLGAGSLEPTSEAPAGAKPGQDQLHASGLFILSMLQREGRLIDFLQEDVAAFSDSEVGAAARVVHEGCRKVVRQYLALEPV